MGSTLYLKNGQFVDVLNGRCFTGCTGVVIKDGKIASMPGLPGEPEPPENCETMDLGGRFVIPGLFNTHTHLQMISGLAGHAELRRRQIEKNLSDCVERGITNIRDAWAPNLAINREFTGRVGSGRIPGPRVQQCVVVCPEGNWCAPRRNMMTQMFLPIVDYRLPDSGAVTFRPDASEREVRDAVDRAIDERGADCVKLYDQDLQFLFYKPGGVMSTDAQAEAAADEARRRGVPVTAHHTRAWMFRRDVKIGVTSLAHLPSDELLTEEDVAGFLAAGCFIEPTLSVSYGMAWSSLGERFRADPDLRALEAYRAETFGGVMESFWLPELAAIYRKNFRNYTNGNFKFMGLFDMSAPMLAHTKSPHRGDNFRLLWKNAGERIACGNDATVVFYTQAAIGLELALMRLYLERGGMPVQPADLLRAATIQSARAMGLDHSFGSIETGKTADLAVLDGNPLEDSRLIGEKAAAVFMGGALAINRCALGVTR